MPNGYGQNGAYECPWVSSYQSDFAKRTTCGHMERMLALRHASISQYRLLCVSKHHAQARVHCAGRESQRRGPKIYNTNAPVPTAGACHSVAAPSAPAAAPPAIATVAGPAGPRGQPGPTGRDGARGATGPAGKDGQPGIAGRECAAWY
eukprot:SAG11_NODE_5383_length_1576_cov_1.901828_1_plen_149_part_00